MGTVLQHKGRKFVTGTPQMKEYNELKAAERENRPGVKSVADMIDMKDKPIIKTPDGREITDVDADAKAQAAKRQEKEETRGMSIPARIKRKFDKNHEPYAGRDPAEESDADRMIEILGRDKVERN